MEEKMNKSLKNLILKRNNKNPLNYTEFEYQNNKSLNTAYVIEINYEYVRTNDIEKKMDK